MSHETTFTMASTEVGENSVVVEFSGNARYGDRSKTLVELNNLVENGRINIVFALPTLVFLDASVMATIVGIYKKVKAIGGNVKVAEFSESANRSWELAGLDEVFPPFATRDQALAALGELAQ